MAVLRCPDCNAIMVLVKLEDGRQFYGCARYPECSTTHGAHPDGSPMGKPADKATRQARTRAHAAFDTLWREAWRIYPNAENEPEEKQRNLVFIARRRAYAWLQEKMNLSKDECHIAMMDAEQCQRVWDLCTLVRAEDIRRWWKDKQKADKAKEPKQEQLW